MEILKKKIWELLEIARNEEVNSKVLKYLKTSLGNLSAKYFYDKDLTFLSFSKTFERDIENGLIKKEVLINNLNKIFNLNKDIDGLTSLYIYKIKNSKKNQSVVYDYQKLVNLLFTKQDFKNALKFCEDGLKLIDLENLDIKRIKLFIDMLLIQNHLKQLLKYDREEILNDMNYISKVLQTSSQYLEENNKSVYSIKLGYLYVFDSFEYKEYKKCIQYSEQFLKLFQNDDIINTQYKLKYKLYETLAYSYLFTKKYEKAINISKNAIELKKRFGDIYIFGIYSVLIESFYALKEYDESLGYAHEANSYVSKDVNKLIYMYEMLAKIYDAKGDKTRVVEYLHKLKRLVEAEKSPAL